MKNIHDLIKIESDKKINFPVGNYSFNLSILDHEGKNLVAFRNSNAIPYSNAAGKFSCIYTGELSDDQIINLEKINFHGYSARLWDRYNGMEDPKIFLWKDDLWCLFVRPNHSITKIFMVMLNLNTGQYITLKDPEGRQFTKNWMPYVKDGELHFVVDVSPFSLYQLVGEELKLIKRNDGLGYPISGGSNIINFDDKLVAVVHGKVELNRKRSYWHAIAQWDKNFNNMKLGKQFVFGEGGVEFCLSIENKNNKMLIPYSLNDDGVNLIQVEEKEFGKLL